MTAVELIRRIAWKGDKGRDEPVALFLTARLVCAASAQGNEGPDAPKALPCLERPIVYHVGAIRGTRLEIARGGSDVKDPNEFRKAVEARNFDDMKAAFREDAVLHSPITVKPFEGREAIAQLLAILIEIFDEFDYTDELTGEDGTLGLVFRARVGDRDVEGIDIVRFDAEGLIRDLTVMVRPRSALEALLAEVGSRLAAAQSSAD
jgi:hypothetical protein